MDGTDEPWWSVPIDDKVVAALILGPAFDDDLHTELRDFAEAFEISGRSALHLVERVWGTLWRARWRARALNGANAVFDAVSKTVKGASSSRVQIPPPPLNWPERCRCVRLATAAAQGAHCPCPR
jgi:hypothetical protein